MKNKKGTIILSIILVVQFLIPLSVWGYETHKIKELEEKGQEVKLSADYVFYDGRGVVFRIEALDDPIYESKNQYIVFENNSEEYGEVTDFSGALETDLYVSVNRLKSWVNQRYGMSYESETTRLYEDYGYFEIYDAGVERANIKHGFCEGPETQAYVVFKVYKNRFKVTGVYIDGVSVDTIIEKYVNDEWDASRYETNYYADDVYYDDEAKDYCRAYYDESGEYITEPVAA